MDISKFLAPHSAEARAHTHLTYASTVPLRFHRLTKKYRENDTDWDTAGPTIDETVVAHCASYRSFEVWHLLRTRNLKPDVTCEEIPLWRTSFHSTSNET